MSIAMISAAQASNVLRTSPPDSRLPTPAPGKDSPELREAFNDFVGQSFFSQLLSQMRKTVGKPAYFHGGMGEELFQGRLDEVLVEHLSEATGDTFSKPMYDLFMMRRG
jgi:peptidoglycan hydrolase FlgJ